MAKSNPVFRTHYDAQYDHKRIHTATGSRYKIEYHPVYDKAGVWHLEPTGKTDIYLEIQSYAMSCDINVIMQRYRNGETDVLSAVQGVYGDVSAIPTNYAEIMNAKLEAERLFASLAADVRAKYNNSVEQFMAEIGTRQGLEKLGVNFDPVQASAAPAAPAESVKEEVTSNES